MSQPGQAIALKQTPLDHGISKAMSEYVSSEDGKFSGEHLATAASADC